MSMPTVRTAAEVFSAFVPKDKDLANTLFAISVVNAMAAKIAELESQVYDYWEQAMGEDL